MDFGYHRNVLRNQMKDTWHIPRASLGGSTSGSSSNSSSKSNSNPPTVTRIHSRHLLRHYHKNDDKEDGKQHKNNLKTATNLENNDNEETLTANTSTCNTSRNNFVGSRISQNYNHNSPTNSRNEISSSYNQNFKLCSNSEDGIKLSNLINKNVDKIGSIKRSSRSSQGSTDSHSSSRSASSGSLLLTAANLERFVAIHNKTQLQQSELFKLHHHLNGQNYNCNITQNPLGLDDNIDKLPNGNNIDTVLTIDDPNLNFIKTKDLDTMSIASSTHFTMVNGVGGPQKKIRSGICSRGHQITVLILTMSSFFLIGILLMVYLIEMRARDMPQQ